MRCVLDQPEGLFDVEALGRQQDGRHAARGLHQLMHAGAMGQRRDHQRRVGLGRTGHQVAQMIGHHKGHLAMGQHCCLGSACRARGEEEPAGIVIVDRSVFEAAPRAWRRYRLAHRLLGEGALADPPGERERGLAGCDRRMIGKVAVAQERLGAGGGREIRHLVRHQPEIGGNPDRAEPEGCKHRPEHLVAILGMDQDAVALDDAACCERRRQRRDTASISRQLQDRSPQMKPGRSP